MASRAATTAGIGKPRRVRMIDVMLIIAIIAGWLAFATIRSPQDAARTGWSLPQPQIVELADGARTAKFDDEDWQRACAEVGLPRPPAMSGGDPVPLGELFRRVVWWVAQHDPDALGELGQIYIALEEHDAALDCFAAAHALKPDDVQWAYFLGAQCQALGLADAAIDIFDELVVRDRDYFTTFARLGQLHLERGELDEAQQSWEACRLLTPDQSLAHVGLGQVALARDDAAAALRHLEEAVKLTPNDFRAHRLLSAALSAVGRLEESRRAAARSDQLPRYSGWLQFDTRLQRCHELAQTQRYIESQLRLAIGAGDSRRAMDWALQLEQRRPKDPYVIGLLGQLHVLNRRPADAIRFADRLIQVQPQSPSGFVLRAQAAMLQRDFSATIAAAGEALARDPNSAAAFDLRGRARFNLDDVRGAIEDMRQAVTLAPQDVNSHNALAEMLLLTRQFDEARMILEGVLQRWPADSTARTLQQRLPSAPG